MNKGEKNSGHTDQLHREHHTMPDEILCYREEQGAKYDIWLLEPIPENQGIAGEPTPYTRTDIYEKVKAERDEPLDILNAFYEGVTVAIEGIMDGGGLNIRTLLIDHDQYQPWLKEQGYDHILEYYKIKEGE